MPGAVTRGWPGALSGLRSEPVPLVGLGQGGIRIRPPRYLRLPRRARGAAAVLRIDAFVALHAGTGAVWAVVEAGLGGRPAWVSAAAVLAPRLSVVPAAGQAWPAARFYIRRRLRDRLARAIAAGAVSRRHGGVLCPG